MDISIILPTYNEAEGITSVISSITRVLDKTKKSYEIVVVDDHSPDGTAQVVEAIRKKNKRVRVIVRKRNPSLGLSILEGIKHSTGKVVIGMDADGNHDPKLLPRLLRESDNHPLVVASRFIAGGGMYSFPRYLTSYLFNLLLRVMGLPGTDNTSGYYAIRRSLLNTLPLSRIYYGYGDYHLRLVHYVDRKGIAIKEIPTYYAHRVGGVSKSRFLQMFLSYFREAVKLQVEKTP